MTAYRAIKSALPWALLILAAAGVALAQNPANRGDVEAWPRAKQRTVSSDNLTLPDFIQGPSEEALFNAWPADAKRLRFEGSAKMRCVVNQQGLLQDCQVENESRPRLGFGLAALKLAPLYKADPALDTRNMPMNFSVPIDVAFVCGTRCKPLEEEDLEHPLVLRPVWDTAPSGSELRAAFPDEAVTAGRGGEVLLQCRVAAQGLLRGCKVGEETPAGFGFGRAAMSLVGKFKLRLPAIPAEMIGAEIRIPVTFALRNGQIVTGPADAIGAPSQAEFRAAVPGGGLAGARATLACTINPAGGLSDCVVAGESPAGQGFAQAAMRLSQAFRFNVWNAEGYPVVGSRAAIPFLFDPPPPVATGPTPRVEYPAWVHQPDIDELMRAFPARAMRQGRGGSVILACTVQEDGHVNICKLEKEDPKGLGFGDAALMLSKSFILRPTVVDGRPIMPTGFEVRVPIEFSIK